MTLYLDKISESFSRFELQFNKLNQTCKELIKKDPKVLESFADSEITDSKINEASLLFIQFTDKSTLEAIKLLCFSLLSGEYIYNENLKENLANFILKVKASINEVDYLPNNLKSIIFNYFATLDIAIEDIKFLYKIP